jgi:2-oxoglutarate ferredoxin oxidoreductase subunit beta
VSYINPKIDHPGMRKNNLGLTENDYKGAISTLCAGCGHDSVTAAIQKAFFEMDYEPYRVAKMSGIGCSSKTPAYFLSQSHGFNSVHGRMPSVTAGANAANRALKYIGISGDGDSLSIGLGQMCHAIRRNVDMLYVVENNGVYGLTKGQFSASADLGSLSKSGTPNSQQPIDPVLLSLALGATYIARSFSGDKEQLVPLIKAGLAHQGFAVIDVISPCVTFNNHKGSTKSYDYTRAKNREIVHTDFIPHADEITVSYKTGETKDVTMHDGSHVLLKKVAADYDPSDRAKAFKYLHECAQRNEVLTGLLYIDTKSLDMHGQNKTVSTPLNELKFSELCPGNNQMQKLMDSYR